MDKALETASLVLTGSRSNVFKIAFLFTAGGQASKVSIQDLRSAAQVLKNIGVKTYLIAIGSKVKRHELNAVTDNFKDVINVLSFDGLQSLVPHVLRIIDSVYGEFWIFSIDFTRKKLNREKLQTLNSKRIWCEYSSKTYIVNLYTPMSNVKVITRHMSFIS